MVGEGGGRHVLPAGRAEVGIDVTFSLPLIRNPPRPSGTPPREGIGHEAGKGAATNG